jgi:hypothetical protein
LRERDRPNFERLHLPPLTGHPVDVSTSRVSGSAPAVGDHDDLSQAEVVVASGSVELGPELEFRLRGSLPLVSTLRCAAHDCSSLARRSNQPVPMRKARRSFRITAVMVVEIVATPIKSWLDRWATLDRQLARLVRSLPLPKGRQHRPIRLRWQVSSRGRDLNP